MKREDADYLIDKALATSGLDSAGNLAFPVKGTREEIVVRISVPKSAAGASCFMCVFLHSPLDGMPSVL